jgi:hypothetical protein
MTICSRKSKVLIALFLAGMAMTNAMVFRRAWWQVVAGYPDYSIFYTAGTMLRHGQGSFLYNDLAQLDVQRQFAAVAQTRSGPLPYNHPPFEAALFVPLTYLSFLRSYELWMALNLGLLGGIVFFLRARIPDLQAIPLWMVALAALASFPVAYALMQGQDSILLLGVYCLTFVWLRRSRDFEAGAWLGLGLFKFHLILPFVLILLLRRRIRFFAGVMLSGVVELLISWLLIGWKELLHYPHYVLAVNQHAAMRIIVPVNMANLRGLFSGWDWSSASSPWQRFALLLASLSLLLWAAWHWQTESKSGTLWNNGFAIAMLATFLVSYHGYNQDMSILFLPLVLLAARQLQHPRSSRYDVALTLALGLMFFSPIYVILTFHFEQQHLFAFVLLALAGILAARDSHQSAATLIPA